MFTTKFRFIGQAVTEEKILSKSTNQKQELPVVAMSVNGSGRNEQSFIGASYQVAVHLQSDFRGEDF